MKTSIATVSVAGSLPDKLAAIARAGFDGVEIFEPDLLTFDGTPAEVGRMARDLGLAVMLFQPFRDFECLPEPLRARAFARAERKFDLMADLGCDLMLVCSSVHPESLGGIDRAAADFRALGERAAARGLRVGYEALAWGRHVSDHRDAWEVVRRADHGSVGLMLDSFHTLGRGIDPDSIRAVPGDRIFFVQLADAPLIPMDLLHWSRHFRNMPGEGDLDVAGFLRAVLATGYAGPLSLEVFNDQYRAGLPRVVAQDGRRSLLNLLDRVRRESPALAPEAPPMPPPAPVEAVAFVEFATSAAEAPGLEALLGTLGFARAGAHRTKPVSLWRQGGVTMLVNAGAEGHARRAFASHGTTVSELGLMVPDAAAAQARAVALGAGRHEEPPPPGDLTIPALRGVGGSVVRLLDRGPELRTVWDLEFPGAAPAGAGAGVLSVDHVGQMTPPDEMASWALWYAAIFGATKTPLVDVADPDGLVSSRAIESGGLRVTLNGPGARRTLAGRFMEETFGSAVHHVALATGDIFATAAALEARGFQRLRIGANYWGDVEARFGLDPAMTARLRSADVLYDADGRGGEFLQLYSAPRADGFFFEVVERRGGYAGYGAPNAPFRIAAQKRALRPAGIPAI